MELTIISDTHGAQEKLGCLSGDVLIHCGDMFNMFSQSDNEFEKMDEWFGKQDFDLILCIGGNHDFKLEERSKFDNQPFKNAVYLEGAGYQYGGYNFFGAPWVPELHGQAFYNDENGLVEKWSDIPKNVDILITHTPPAGILDVSSRGLTLGCHFLTAAIERCRPIVHCFGHVHASSGVHKANGITYVNAALANSRYELSRQPYEMEL
jgi:Icc-related predicted phosphoesterase